MAVRQYLGIGSGLTIPDRLATLSWRRRLLVVAVVAVVVRVGLIAATPHFVPWGDPADYARNAGSIALGHGMAVTGIATPGSPSAFRPPAYPFLLGGVWSIFGINLTVGRLLSALLGTVVVLLLACLGKAVMNQRVGLIAGVASAVFLPLVALNGTYLSESLFIPLEIGLALTLLRLQRSGGMVRWAALAGILCGLAALTRSVGVLWLLPALVVACVSSPSRGHALRSTVAAAAAFLVILVPWTVRNFGAFHAFVPMNTQGGFTLAGQYNDEAGHVDALHTVWRDPLQVATLKPIPTRLVRAHGGTANEAQIDSAYLDAAVDYLIPHPTQVLAASWLNSLRMFDTDSGHNASPAIAYTEMGLPHPLWGVTTLSAQLLLGLAAAALLMKLTGRLQCLRGPWFMWALPGLAIAGTVPIIGTPRYRTPADPFLLLIAAPGIAWLSARTGQLFSRRRSASQHSPRTLIRRRDPS